MGQEALQVTAECTASEMLQRPGLPHQGKEGRVEFLVLLDTGEEDSVGTALGSHHPFLLPNRARKGTLGSISKSLLQTFRTHSKGVFF